MFIYKESSWYCVSSRNYTSLLIKEWQCQALELTHANRFLWMLKGSCSHHVCTDVIRREPCGWRYSLQNSRRCSCKPRRCDSRRSCQGTGQNAVAASGRLKGLWWCAGILAVQEPFPDPALPDSPEMYTRRLSIRFLCLKMLVSHEIIVRWLVWQYKRNLNPEAELSTWPVGIPPAAASHWAMTLSAYVASYIFYFFLVMYKIYSWGIESCCLFYGFAWRGLWAYGSR